VKAELAHDPPQLLVVADRVVQELLGNLRKELGQAGADHVADAVRGVGLGWVALLKLLGPAHLPGILVRDHQPLDLAVLAEHVDRTPVREGRNRELHQARERLLELQRRREQLARLGDEREALASGSLCLVQAGALERERRLAGQSDLHLPPALAERHVLAEREPEHADDPAFEDERQDRERVAVLALAHERRESVLRSAMELMKSGLPVRATCDIGRSAETGKRP